MNTPPLKLSQNQYYDSLLYSEITENVLNTPLKHPNYKDQCIVILFCYFFLYK